MGVSPDGRNLPRGVTGYWAGRGTERRIHYRIRPEVNGVQKSESFDDLEDALDRLAVLRLEKRKGKPAKVESKTTLRQFVREEWLPNHAEVELDPNTLDSYMLAWQNWIRPFKIVKLPLASITTEEVRDEWAVKVKKKGIGDQTFLRCCAILSSIFRFAGESPRRTGVYVNPITNLRKPKRKTLKKRPHTYSPAVFEEVRWWLRNEQHPVRRDLGRRDALMVSLMAYAGLHPGEVLFLRRRHVREHVIDVPGAVSQGRQKRTKTNIERHAPLPDPLRDDLLEYMVALGPDDLLFPGADGKCWEESDYRNWRRRIWGKARKIAAERSGEKLISEDSPYSARHSYCGLQIRCGMGANLSQLARWMGTSVAVISETYENVIAEFADAKPRDITKEIRDARARVEARRRGP